jgi:MFS transporter, FSR family, fosmidomycin resistance protein
MSTAPRRARPASREASGHRGLGCPQAIQCRPALTAAGLVTALAVEFADELVDGTKSAAMPLIKHDLALTYFEVGLLVAVPLLLGSVIEAPVGVLSGTGRRRRRFILAGGVVFIAAVLGAGLAPSFAALLAALVIFFPASGTFVSLTQSAMMDADPGRRAKHMARWTLAGSAGDVAGPLLVAAVLVAGGGWRLAFLLVAAVATASWLLTAASGRGEAGPGDQEEQGAEDVWPGLRAAIRITARAGALRWLVLLEVSDLLLDVFTAFLALYLVAVVHVSPAVAALGVAVRLGAGLAGGAALVPLLERLDSRRVLRGSVAAAGLLFPAFLLVPGLGPKLAILAALSIATAAWYPVLKAELFASLPGRSGLAVSLASVAGLAGGFGPLAVGLLAQRLGVGWALAALVVVPVGMLAALPRHRPAGQRRGLD